MKTEKWEWESRWLEAHEYLDIIANPEIYGLLINPQLPESTFKERPVSGQIIVVMSEQFDDLRLDVFTEKYKSFKWV